MVTLSDFGSQLNVEGGGKRLKLEAGVAGEWRRPDTQPIPAMEPEQPRRILRLSIWRGSLPVTCSRAADDVAGAAAAGLRAQTMDPELWSRLPDRDELIWEVLRFLPATQHFQLHSVSPQWRRELRSTYFRNRVAARGPEVPPLPRVVACLQVIEEHGDNVNNSSKSRDSISSEEKSMQVLDINLSSFVPAWFWSTYSGAYYSVVAAAEGLVCISNDSEMEHYNEHDEVCDADPDLVEQQLSQPDWLTACREHWKPWASRYCVLNPLTSTCVVLPPLPFWPAQWLPPTATAVVIYSLDWQKGEVRVATYDLATGGGGAWVVAAHKCRSLHVDEHLRLEALLTLCGVAGDTKNWWCHEDDRVRVLEAAAAGGVGDPSVAALGLDPAAFQPCPHDGLETELVAHRGAVFAVATPKPVVESKYKRPDDVVCCVWRLQAAPAPAGGRLWRGSPWRGCSWGSCSGSRGSGTSGRPVGRRRACAGCGSGCGAGSWCTSGGALARTGTSIIPRRTGRGCCCCWSTSGRENGSCSRFSGRRVLPTAAFTGGLIGSSRVPASSQTLH